MTFEISKLNRLCSYLTVTAVVVIASLRGYFCGSALRPWPLVSDNFTVMATERFDASAAIVLDVGVDGQPGRAGVDDNFNGVTDDALELGAVGGDDRILSPLDPAYHDALAADSTRVMGRGAFVPSADSEDLQNAASREVRTVNIAGRTRVWFDVSR